MVAVRKQGNGDSPRSIKIVSGFVALLAIFRQNREAAPPRTRPQKHPIRLTECQYVENTDMGLLGSEKIICGCIIYS